MTSGQGNVIFSPESTVTSLLASSGHLRGTQRDNDLSLTGIRYRDRDYESATEALEAYIADFDRSLHTSETSTGRLQLQKSLISSALPRTEFRNKDVLRERLTDRELDFLNLPVGSGHRGASDCISLTTDDLLVLPCDGSLPVTRTSAFLTQSGDYPLGQSSHSNSWSSRRPRPNSSSHIKRCLHYSAPHNTPHKLYQSRAGTQAQETQKTEPFTGPRVKGSLWPQPQHGLYHQTTDSPGPFSPHHDYPRWLTSQKSEMDFSGVTSIPDLKYPAWLQECDNVPKDIPTTNINLSESHKKTQHRGWGPTQTLPPSPRPPSWLGELEASYEELKEGQKDSNGGHLEDVSGSDDDRQQLLRGEADHRTLREFRLHFSERLALAAEGERSTDFHKVFGDDKIESLISKAEKVLNSPSLGLNTNSQLQNSPSLGLTSQLQKDMGHSPGGSEDVLEADRSWDNPVITFKSPVPVGGAEDTLVTTEPLRDRKDEAASGSCSSGYSSRKHPGPVEALKQMLFSLQAVEQQVSLENDTTEKEVTSENGSTPTSEDGTQPLTIMRSDDYDTAFGGQSLKRALHHLGRLKSLVEDSAGVKATSQEGKYS
ncbi:lung adenoma susceptibility protein 2 isoform X1 [Salvelinus namaycush]|uniref:Lung adenoma susceptibility protein 2 isoform X1 n=1 Tax=Salvelinus namaycush TaxID=8040 RepID=A0A8U0UA82_SALNM|nr:lung adenoma susceptibility protein 2 isoform X1 [Salvelinus namaycush]